MENIGKMKKKEPKLGKEEIQKSESQQNGKIKKQKNGK